MTIKAKIFRICLVLQYVSFFGLISTGIYESDAFDPRLLLPITLLGVACGINTWAVLEKPSGRRESDAPQLPTPLRRPASSSDARNNGQFVRRSDR
jgi:hypothetical protein